MPELELYNENELLFQLKKGEKSAFIQLYQLYSERLYLKILKLVKSETVAEELLQDIFLNLWERRESIDIHQSFRSYLFRIGENKACDFFRKLKKDRQLYNHIKSEAIVEYKHVEETLLTREKVYFLQKAIDTLPPQRKMVFHLYKIEGKSYKEISSMLGISTSTINDHVVKAMRSIRKFLQSHPESGFCIYIFMNF